MEGVSRAAHRSRSRPSSLRKSQYAKRKPPSSASSSAGKTSCPWNRAAFSAQGRVAAIGHGEAPTDRRMPNHATIWRTSSIGILSHAKGSACTPQSASTIMATHGDPSGAQRWALPPCCASDEAIQFVTCGPNQQAPRHRRAARRGAARPYFLRTVEDGDGTLGSVDISTQKAFRGPLFPKLNGPAAPKVSPGLS